MTIGALGAASFLLRPDLAALWIAIGIYWLLLRGAAFRKLGWAALGGGCALLFVAALFGTFGAFGALWDAVIVYNFAYSDASLPERLASVRYLSTEIFFASLLTLAGWVIGIFCLAKGRVQGDRRKALLATALILLLLQIVSISLPGYGWPHYYLAALPAATVLLALIMWFVLEQERIFLKLLLVALFGRHSVHFLATRKLRAPNREVCRRTRCTLRILPIALGRSYPRYNRAQRSHSGMGQRSWVVSSLGSECALTVSSITFP